MSEPSRPAGVLSRIMTRLDGWLGVWRRVRTRRLPPPPAVASTDVTTDASRPGVTDAPSGSAGPPADWLARTQPSGPPAHWLERVRQGAPQLLEAIAARPGQSLPRPPQPPPTTVELPTRPHAEPQPETIRLETSAPRPQRPVVVETATTRRAIPSPSDVATPSSTARPRPQLADQPSPPARPRPTPGLDSPPAPEPHRPWPGRAAPLQVTLPTARRDVDITRPTTPTEVGRREGLRRSTPVAAIAPRPPTPRPVVVAAEAGDNQRGAVPVATLLDDVATATASRASRPALSQATLPAMASRRDAGQGSQSSETYPARPAFERPAPEPMIWAKPAPRRSGDEVEIEELEPVWPTLLEDEPAAIEDWELARRAYEHRQRLTREQEGRF